MLLSYHNFQVDVDVDVSIYVIGNIGLIDASYNQIEKWSEEKAK
jgi:hypothetical protein